MYEGTCVNLLYGPYPIPPEEKPKTVIKLICRKAREAARCVSHSLCLFLGVSLSVSLCACLSLCISLPHSFSTQDTLPIAPSADLSLSACLSLSLTPCASLSLRPSAAASVSLCLPLLSASLSVSLPVHKPAGSLSVSAVFVLVCLLLPVCSSCLQVASFGFLPP